MSTRAPSGPGSTVTGAERLGSAIAGKWKADRCPDARHYSECHVVLGIARIKPLLSFRPRALPVEDVWATNNPAIEQTFPMAGFKLPQPHLLQPGTQ